MKLKLRVIEFQGNKAEDMCMKFILKTSEDRAIQKIWADVLHNRLLFRIGVMNERVYKNRIKKLLESAESKEAKA